MTINRNEKREQLTREGFCVFEGVLDPRTVTKLNKASDLAVSQEDPKHFKTHRAQGSLISLWKFPDTAFTELVADPRALRVFSNLGFEHPKFWSGFIISKPPYAPPLYWHQDSHLWGHPIGYTNQPQMYFLMYYLVDTNSEKGCLRVIPGSHRKRHALHDLDRGAHEKDEVMRADNLDHPALKRAHGELDVPVRAGDVIIGDARLLHSANANNSSERRTVLTLWYWPTWVDLPEEIQAMIALKFSRSPETVLWAKKTRELTQFLIPEYSGDATPIESNNLPGPELN